MRKVVWLDFVLSTFEFSHVTSWMYIDATIILVESLGNFILASWLLVFSIYITFVFWHLERVNTVVCELL